MSQNPRSKLKNNGLDFTPTIHSDTYEYINPSQFDLKNKAVLITGASKGVGRHAAVAYAAAGASQIAIAARSDMKEVQSEMVAAANKAGKTPPQVIHLSLDVSNEESVSAAAKEIQNTFGRLDILVNNAGYLENFVPITESDPQEWWKTWEVNIRGPYLVTRALLTLMLKSPHGLKTVLNVSSIGANNLTPGAFGYQMGKLAILRFAEHLNNDYAEQGVLSYGIHPGGILTELGKRMPARAHPLLTDQPALAGDTIVWLTSERREWLAGRYVSCTWDMKELEGKRKKIEEENLLKVRMDVGVD